MLPLFLMGFAKHSAQASSLEVSLTLGHFLTISFSFSASAM
jgi:hypothetical protein